MSRRLRIGFLVGLLLWLSPGLPWCSTCYAATSLSPALPLVLIAEPGKGVTALPKEFYAACEREGYVTGSSLFETTPDDFPDLGRGAEQVAAFVNARAGESGEGSAGLIPDRAVRNLVMVAAPNRGSFLACLLKSAVEIAKHESLFERDSRSWRFLPTGDDILSLFSLSGGDVEPAYNRLTVPEDQEWSDETAWVVERVRDVYEPLYARYVEARYSAIPYVPAESPKETFAGDDT